MADVTQSRAGSPNAKAPTSVWLIIFTDLVALLLTFFVMLFNKPKLVFIFFSKLPNPPLELKKVLNL